MMYFDPVARESTKVADLPSLFLAGGLTVSHDGHTALFHGNDHSEGDIMLVEGWKEVSAVRRVRLPRSRSQRRRTRVVGMALLGRRLVNRGVCTTRKYHAYATAP